MASPVKAIPVDSFVVSANPFPMPKVHTVSVVKRGPLGIVFLADTQRVLVKRIEPDSPLKGTAIAPRQVLLTVNGCPVYSPHHGVALISSTPTGATVTLVSCDELKVPTIKMVLFRTTWTNPRVHFGATRGGSLVQIARIFPFSEDTRHDSAATTGLLDLREGDIVLAVNGFAVSNPDSAMRAMQRTQSTEDTVLYVLDREQFRQEIIEEIKTKRKQDSSVHIKPLVQEDPLFDRTDLYDFRIGHSKHGRVLTRVCFDPQTHHMVDPYPALNMGSGEAAILDWDDPQTSFKASYVQTVLPYLKEYNRSSDWRLTQLEQYVCAQAWQNLALSNQIHSIGVPNGKALSSSKLKALPVASARLLPQSGQHNCYW